MLINRQEDGCVVIARNDGGLYLECQCVYD